MGETGVTVMGLLGAGGVTLAGLMGETGVTVTGLLGAGGVTLAGLLGETGVTLTGLLGVTGVRLTGLLGAAGVTLAITFGSESNNLMPGRIGEKTTVKTPSFWMLTKRSSMRLMTGTVVWEADSVGAWLVVDMDSISPSNSPISAMVCGAGHRVQRPAPSDVVYRVEPVSE
ncbi:hypothetical protein [Herbaspirillum sp. NPDC087042]|uniref:hypothetical protein n=1 Tax=Herbaspirillum sp. NPDC087042 TaxID=3364004 RepID=UPI0038255A72